MEIDLWFAQLERPVIVGNEISLEYHADMSYVASLLKN